MDFKIGKYQVKLTEGALHIKDTEKDERYACGLLNGYNRVQKFLMGKPSEKDFCMAFDIS